jgi:hypothetical protein
MLNERRASSRVRAYRPVRLHLPRSPRVLETLTKDLSVGGVCCISPTAFPISTELNLEFVLSTGEGSITARGRTTWFRSLPHSEQFDLGITFLDMPETDKRRLSVYLGRLSEKFPMITA